MWKSNSTRRKPTVKSIVRSNNNSGLHTSDEPYFMRFCKDSRQGALTISLNPEQFFTSVSESSSIPECIIILTSEKGKKVLVDAVNKLDYESASNLESLMELFMVLGSIENFSGTQKLGIIEICSSIFESYKFSQLLLKSVEQNKITNLNPLCWLIQVIICYDETNKYQNDPTVKKIIDVLKAKCNKVAIKLLDNLSSGTSHYSTEELLMAEPMHDNDFPDNYRKIAIFPSKQELMTDSPAYRGWHGDENAHHVKLLDRQFRYLREDLIAPLKDEIRNAHMRRHLMLKKPIIDTIDIDSRPSLWISFIVPDYLRKRFPHDRDMTRFLSTDGGHIYSTDSIILFLKETKDQKFTLQSLGTLTKTEKVISGGRIKLAVFFQSAEAIDILNLKFSKDYKDTIFFTHAIIAKASFFAYEPILKVLRDTTILPLEEELVNLHPIVVPSETPITIPNKVTELLTCDESQLKALQTAMTQRVSLIQGPPGTGKTFLGIQAVKTLLAAPGYSPKILCLCYTNHALDSFLESLLDNGIPLSNILRLGNFKKISTRLQDCGVDSLSSTFQKYENQRHFNLKDQKNCCSTRIYELFDVCSRTLSPWKAWKVLGRYLEENHIDIYNQLKLPKKGEFTLVGEKGGKVWPDYYYQKWYEGKEKPSGVTAVSSGIEDVWELSKVERQNMAKLWIDDISGTNISKITSAMSLYESISTRHRNLRDEPHIRSMRSKQIVACTTTYAAKNHALIDGYGATTILIEEAAEIHESHILTNLNPHVKRLIMIGDHKQLRPKLESYPLRTDSGNGIDFDKSLFERLIDTGYPYSALSIQHRMRPEISQMIRHTYPHLIDAERVQGRDNIKGVQKNIVFINHRQLENSDADILDMNSKTNLFEVKFIVKMVTYLLQQGYQSEDITILTPYLGQLRLLRKELKHSSFTTVMNDLDDADMIKNTTTTNDDDDLDSVENDNTKQKGDQNQSIRVATIDNYQGEESKIILASLVRSNDTGDIGFMSGPERVNVLFSRARDGFYIIGNSETFSNARNPRGRELWVKIFTTLRENNLIYDGFPIVCNKHQYHQVIKTPEEFNEKCRDGGCNLPCNTILKCIHNHTCTRSCHPETSHDNIRCRFEMKSMCARNLHSNTRYCYQSLDMVSPCIEMIPIFCERQHQIFIRCCDQQSKKKPCRKCIEIDKRKKDEEAIILQAQQERDTKLQTLQLLQEQYQAELMDLNAQKSNILTQITVESEILAIKNKIEKIKIDIDHIKTIDPLKSVSMEEIVTNSNSNINGTDSDEVNDDKDYEKITYTITELKSLKPCDNSENSINHVISSDSSNNDTKGNTCTSSKLSSDDSINNKNQSMKFINENTRVNNSIKDNYDLVVAKQTASTLPVTTTSINFDSHKVLEWIKSEDYITCMKYLTSFDTSPTESCNASTIVIRILLLLIRMKLGDDLHILKTEMEYIRLIYQNIFDSNDLAHLSYPSYGFSNSIISSFFHYTAATIFTQFSEFQNLSHTHASKYLIFAPNADLPSIWIEEMNRLCNLTATSNILKSSPDSVKDRWNHIISNSPSKKSPSSAMDSLLQMTGLETVKESFIQLYQRIILSKEQNKSIEMSNFNTRFDGNPGTGKTTVAELFCRFCIDIGLLPAKASILKRIGSELGTKGVSALEKDLITLSEKHGGGIIFIDEAYQLDNTKGHEIIDFILGHAEKLKGKYGLLIWVFAGYKSKMDDLFQYNIGLPSRFPYTYNFEDYTNEELLGIFKGLMDRGGADIPISSSSLSLSSTTNNTTTSTTTKASSLLATTNTRPDEVDEWGNIWHWNSIEYIYYDDYNNKSYNVTFQLGSIHNPIISITTNISWSYNRDKSYWYNRFNVTEISYTYPGKSDNKEFKTNIISSTGGVFIVSNEKWLRIAITRLGKLRGTIGFGNARAVRNLFDLTHNRQVKRISQLRTNGYKPDIHKFERNDLLGPKATKMALEMCSAWKELNKMEGLGKVKKSIEDLLDLVVTNADREEQEKRTLDVALNRIFLGNPGTGKTTVANLYAQILTSLGMLSKGEVIVKSVSDFIGSAMGQSEEMTNGILEQSKGCVLVIDEAYGLYSPTGSGNDPYREAVINTLVEKVQGVPGDDRVVILIGYREPMTTMLSKCNPGLARRFQLDEAFEFEDYDDTSLLRILRQQCLDQGLTISVDTASFAIRQLGKAKSGPHFGNAGAITNLLSKAKLKMQRRKPVNDELIQDDFVSEGWTDDIISEEDLFHSLVGCENIKSQLRDYRSLVELYRQSNKNPLDILPFNFLFTGSPGTGKTTVARLMGRMFQSLQMIPCDEVIEVSASKLMTGYVGQTGKKTSEYFERAKGKVLFIDEAYQLNPKHGGSFMSEAIDEIVKNLTLETYKNKMVVILAGYKQPIEDMIQVNPGLQSRFTECIHFEDFNEDIIHELITKRMVMNENAKNHLPTICTQLKRIQNFANGRDIDTYIKKVQIEIAKRFKQDPSDIATVNDLDAGLYSMLKGRSGSSPTITTSTTTTTQDMNMTPTPMLQYDHMTSSTPPQLIHTYKTTVAPQMNSTTNVKEDRINTNIGIETEKESMEKEVKEISLNKEILSVEYLIDNDSNDSNDDDDDDNNSRYNMVLTQLQQIVEDQQLNTKEGIEQLKEQLDILSIQVSNALNMSIEEVKKLLNRWSCHQEIVKQQLYTQLQEMELALQEGRSKAKVPIWRCAICGRADKPQIICYVSPFIVRYEEIDV